jgi:hypothetical protein
MTAYSSLLPAPYPPWIGCVCCDADQERECICSAEEKALRTWANGRGQAMTPEQREWCAAEIDSVECHDRKDYEGGTDAELAMGVLRAWQDFARDKGLL